MTVADFKASNGLFLDLTRDVIIMRTIVDLPKEQIEALDSSAKAKGISRAAAVRESVAAYLPDKKKKRDLNYGLKHPAFGSWKGPKVDSVEYVRKLRADWDHRG